MMTTRILLFGTLGLAVALPLTAQSPQASSPEALLEAAQKAEAAWATLAQDLDSRVSRFLPCDARATRAIQEVASASATRLAAVALYQKALIDASTADTDVVRQLVAAERETLATIPPERTDIAQEHAGVESQILNLGASLRQRPSLSGALEQLQAIQTMIAQRATTAGNLVAASEQITARLNELLSVLEKRDEALRQEATAFEAERARWNAFYTARAERARMECTITGGGR